MSAPGAEQPGAFGAGADDLLDALEGLQLERSSASVGGSQRQQQRALDTAGAVEAAGEVAAAGREAMINDLPDEILSRIFAHVSWTR